VAKTIHSGSYRALLAELRDQRISAGVSQMELAARLGRAQTWVSKVELGERRLDVEELRQVCAALDQDLIPFIKRWLAAIK
jgi:transcriptional regulator with XRE-family HTH domain